MADMTGDEIVAGVAAAHAAIQEHVPGWEQNLIPQEAVVSLVTAVVNAVDDVRAAAASNVIVNLPHGGTNAPTPNVVSSSDAVATADPNPVRDDSATS
jgi:hypothetical protein